ncbi:hypothetical protein PG996_007461 [Apiospora saccharicola]|uniref:Uncharacterized protein n=1 Tax=Apiospora saccharicola TaxID=335842 RepID=A0ABR1VAW1_9PEZI
MACTGLSDLGSAKPFSPTMAAMVHSGLWSGHQVGVPYAGFRPWWVIETFGESIHLGQAAEGDNNVRIVPSGYIVKGTSGGFIIGNDKFKIMAEMGAKKKAKEEDEKKGAPTIYSNAARANSMCQRIT